MAPEFFATRDNHSKYTNKVDIYALGVSMYYLCSKKYDIDEMSLLDAMKAGKGVKCTGYSESLNSLMMEMLAFDSSCRPTCSQIIYKIN